MSTIREALTTYLKAHTGLAALVGAKVYPETIPQGQTPPLVTVGSLNPVELQVAELVQTRVDCHCWATTALVADAIAVQVRKALYAYHGTMSGLHVHGKVLTRRSMYVPQAQLYRTTLEAQFLYREPTS